MVCNLNNIFIRLCRVILKRVSKILLVKKEIIKKVKLFRILLEENNNFVVFIFLFFFLVGLFWLGRFCDKLNLNVR